jgi:ribose transport system substrate-binding protein
MSKGRVLLAITLVAMLLASVSGIGLADFDPDRQEDSLSYAELVEKLGPVPTDKLPKDIRMGAVLKNLANQFWQQLAEGYKDVAAEYGVGVDIQAARTETELQEQLSILETMLLNNYAAYLLSPLSNDNLNRVVYDLNADKIPVINVNCEYINDADVFVGTRQLDIGIMAADFIGERLNGVGKVAIIEGVPGSYTSINRTSGFLTTIEEKYPNIEIVASVPADYERQKGMDVAMDILTQNPDLDAIFACNDNMALGAVEAIRMNDVSKLGKVIVIGADGTDAAYDSIGKGELTGTVDQFPRVNGAIAMEVVLRILAGQSIPRVVSTPMELIHLGNIDDFNN